jgi:hypothetical protein
MVRSNVPVGTSAISQNRSKAATNNHRSKTVSKNPVRNASTRTTKASIPPTESSIHKTVTNLDAASGKKKLMMEFIPIFDEYQKYCVKNVSSTANDGDDVNVDDDETARDNSSKHQLRNRLVRKIISLCDMNCVVSEMTNLSVIDENNDEMDAPKSVSMSERMTMMTECLVHILNSAMAHLLISPATSTATSNGRNTSLIASSAILELLMSVTVEWMNEPQNRVNETDIVRDNHNGCVEIILSLLCQYSECQNDTIRILSVRALCNLAECFGSNVSTADDATEQQRLDRLDTIQQALLPRFTDKAIAVRCAVMQACFISSEMQSNPLRTDPDLLQAIQWIVQHDPSPNNRIVAIQHVPINRTTMEYLIPRIRDTKINVRLAAIAALSKAVDRYIQVQSEKDESLNIDEPPEFLLPGRHIAEIINAGFTDRYVGRQ